MSEFRVEKPGFYWRRDGHLAWVSCKGISGAWVAHCHLAPTRYSLRPSGLLSEEESCADLIEYIGPTMPETMTRPEPEKKLRPWTVDEVPVGAVVIHVNSAWPRLITTVNAVGLWVDGYVLSFGLFTKHYKWKWPHEDNDAWRPCGVLE